MSHEGQKDAFKIIDICTSIFCKIASQPFTRVSLNGQLDNPKNEDSYFWRCDTCGTPKGFYIPESEHHDLQTSIDTFFKDRALLSDSKKAFMDDY